MLSRIGFDLIMTQIMGIWIYTDEQLVKLILRFTWIWNLEVMEYDTLYGLITRCHYGNNLWI